MSVVSQLYRLQLVDSERDEKSGRLAQVEAMLGESQELLKAREAIDEATQVLAAQRTELRALELEIATLNDKLKKNQDRLYSGRVRNPKELTGLHEEAGALRRRRSELEDDQLELMIAIEDQEAELAERQARLRQIESNWREEQAGLLAEKERLAQQLAELDQECQQIRDRIPAADLHLYDDLRQQQGGKAVALLKRGICQGCGVDVPTSLARSVERGEGMSFCPICNRLLYGG
jgi:predicted  nucleic acid-binding Zn-ribbon protein